MNSSTKLLLIILFVSCDDIGEGYQWQNESSAGFSRRFGTVGYDYGWSAAYSPFDEGFIIVGERNPNIFGKSDLWAIKTNSKGTMEWEKNFGGDEIDVGYDVIATSDGGFLFVGHSWSFGNQQQVYAVKTDFHGKIKWEKTFGGGMWDVGNAVIELTGGGFLIAGYSNSPGISSGNSDFYLIKIDVNGNLIWQKAYGNQSFPNHEWANDIVELPDQGMIIVGARDRYSDGSLNGLVIRIDSEGNLIWEKEFLNDYQTDEVLFSISSSIDGYYYLCSSNNSTTNLNIYQPQITKMDASGNIDWQRTYKSKSRSYHQFNATTTSLGDIVLVGSSYQELPMGYKEDAFMMKIDSKGNILWNNSYGSSDEDDWGWKIFETPKNNLVFVGSTKSFGASLFDIYLVITNSEGFSK